MFELRNARTVGTLEAMTRAEPILDRAATNRPAAAWRVRIFELAEALFQSIRMQLSVPRYKAISVDRGANLDTLDAPLNNRVWLKQSFAELRRIPDEAERLRVVRELMLAGSQSLRKSTIAGGRSATGTAARSAARRE